MQRPYPKVPHQLVLFASQRLLRQFQKVIFFKESRAPTTMIDRARHGLMHMTWSELEALPASGHGINNPGGHLANAAIELSTLGELNVDLALDRLNLILSANGQIEWNRRLAITVSRMPSSPLKDLVNPLDPGR